MTNRSNSLIKNDLANNHGKRYTFEMSLYSLYCAILFGPLNRIFPVDIAERNFVDNENNSGILFENLTFGHLRELICNKKKNYFPCDIFPHELSLWKVEDLNKGNAKWKKLKMMLAYNTKINITQDLDGYKLDMTKKVQEIFPRDKSSDNNVHILVQLLSPVTLEPFSSHTAITKERMLNFFKAHFMRSPANPLITTFGHSFPLVGRKTTAMCLTKSFVKQFEAANKAGSPGIGKTRNLIETIPMIRDCFNNGSVNNIISGEMRKTLATLLKDPVQILMTYNNGSFPQNMEKILGANAAIGLRILHYYFSSNLSLDRFLELMIREYGQESLKQYLSVKMAIDIIAANVRGEDMSRKLLIYIALDEFQRLVGSPFCEGNDEQQERKYLKEVILALGNAMCHKFSNDNIFIICHLAGTVLTPLSSVTAGSSYKYLVLPTPLLLPEDIDFLFEQLDFTTRWWRTALPLRATAYDIMLPRGIESFLEYISTSISKNIPPSEIDYIQASNCARNVIKFVGITPSVAKEILINMVLQYLVRRTDIISSNTKFTWEYLESQGFLMLTPCENEYYKVIMPYMYAGKLVSNCGSDAGMGNLSWLFSHEINTNGEIIDFYWASFELYCCHLLACFEELYCLKSHYTNLHEFYKGARFGKGVQQDLRFQLANSVQVKTSLHRCPGPNVNITCGIKDDQGHMLNLYEGNTIIKNAEGAPCDSIDIRLSDNFWLIRCGQYKYYLNNELTLELITSEYTKTKNAIYCYYNDKSNNYQWYLWICTTADVEEIELPDNVILTDKSSFHEFFGIFSTRIQFMTVNKININTANINILKHIYDVGIARAQKVINNRPYRDRSDVINKLKGLIPNDAINNIIESVEY